VTFSGRSFLPVHVATVGINLHLFPNYSFRVSRLLGHGTGVMKLNAVTQVNTVLCHMCLPDDQAGCVDGAV
jgi:hypothetical protein